MPNTTRLDPPVWVMTPLGEADAEFLIDRGPEHHLQWVVWIHETGECWTFRNPEIRRATNVTMGRDAVSVFGADTVARFQRFQPPVDGPIYDDLPLPDDQ